MPTPYPRPPQWVRTLSWIIAISIAAPIILSLLLHTRTQHWQLIALLIVSLWVAVFGFFTITKPFTISAYFERRTMLGPITPQNTQGKSLLGFRIVGAVLFLIGTAIAFAACVLLRYPLN